MHFKKKEWKRTSNIEWKLRIKKNNGTKTQIMVQKSKDDNTKPTTLREQVRGQKLFL